MATEFTNMIEAERGYQANSSVISTADTMMQTLIQMAQARRFPSDTAITARRRRPYVDAPAYAGAVTPRRRRRRR